VLLEALAIGGAGGLAGALVGRLAGAAGDLLWARYLPPFPFRPETIFSFPAWLFAASVAVAVVSALLGAVAPAARAARIDPARALS
jgi:ABC-type antimicrobial peptide transport system permease subunit